MSIQRSPACGPLCGLWGRYRHLRQSRVTLWRVQLGPRANCSPRWRLLYASVFALVWNTYWTIEQTRMPPLWPIEGRTAEGINSWTPANAADPTVGGLQMQAAGGG